MCASVLGAKLLWFWAHGFVLTKKVRPLRSAPCGWNKNQDDYGVVTTLTVAPLIWVKVMSVPVKSALKTRAVDAADSSPQYITQDVSLAMLTPS